MLNVKFVKFFKMKHQNPTKNLKSVGVTKNEHPNNLT